ncbi:RNB domain-containing ribonuclease [Schaalia sp. ZJ405]|uniref:RNB domain-containing ribonuclease n=1 Tax=Schaalia sp. ZJ405 TaxID=2709403 RepID=UPI0013E9E328|nr:RNB domain-containing ribonuclease [Schaalia sp. ZJ405]QPK81174.1 RNB domain-containing ribonuclease [Schaalia sp. ZJ405]
MVQLNRFRLSVDDSSLVPVLKDIRAELEIPSQFPDDVIRQAQRASIQWDECVALAGLRPPPDTADSHAGDIYRLNDLPTVDCVISEDEFPDLDRRAIPRVDATAIPFVTIDPRGSRDLDQAVHLARLPGEDPANSGFLVTYAIASLATFVPPGSPLDTEVRGRGLTVYMADQSTPLHPPELSEGAASLLPGQIAPACVWQIELSPTGAVVCANVTRAFVCPRAQLSYDEVEDARLKNRPLRGAPLDLVPLLEEIGTKRRARETARGGVSAPTPEQEIVRIPDADGGSHYALRFRANTLVEEWNAQISLLTGICAAAKMRDAGLGILRVVPPAPDAEIERLRAVAHFLGVLWQEDEPYAQLVPSLDPVIPAHTAFLIQAMRLYRGASYMVLTDFPEPGDPQIRHTAIAAEYAHATAPLRRLVDRWSLEICLAHDEAREIPAWVRESIESIPPMMTRAAQRASAAEKKSLGAISAKLLIGYEGELFRSVIVHSSTPQRGKVMLNEPAVIAPVTARTVDDQLPVGAQTEVELLRADVAARRVEFMWPGE